MTGRCDRAKVERLLASLPTPHAAPLRGLKAPVRTWEQAMLDLAEARSIEAEVKARATKE